LGFAPRYSRSVGRTMPLTLCWGINHFFINGINLGPCFSVNRTNMATKVLVMGNITATKFLILSFYLFSYKLLWRIWREVAHMTNRNQLPSGHGIFVYFLIRSADLSAILKVPKSRR
jgi:hypothetical protein